MSKFGYNPFNTKNLDMVQSTKEVAINDARYLKLDQTTPQDISSGQPDFLAGLRAGSTNQLSIDASGNILTTGTLGAGATTLSSLNTHTIPGGTGTLALTSDLHSAITITDTASVDLGLTGQALTATVLPAGVDHNSLANLATGDVHTQYALLAGRAGGQTLAGDTASGGNLTLQSTSHATKGKILFGTSAYDEVNNRVGIGTATPAHILTVKDAGTVAMNDFMIGMHADDDAPFLAGFFNDTYSTTVPVFEYFGFNSGTFMMGSPVAKDVGIFTSNQYTNPAFILKSTDRVGIRQTNPVAVLSVGAPHGNDGIGLFSTSLTGTKGWVFYPWTNGTNTDMRLYEYGASGERVTFQSGGKVGIGTTAPGAQLQVNAGAAATIGQIIKGAASQTANLYEWQSSAAAIYSTVSENGYYTTRKTSAPADAELSNSEVAYWLTDTVGATVFNIKAKDSAGTVRTGSVALA